MLANKFTINSKSEHGKESRKASPDQPESGRQTANEGKVKGLKQNHPRQPVYSDKHVGKEVILARFIRLCSASMAAVSKREAAAMMVNRIGEVVNVDRAILVPARQKNPILAVTGGGMAAQDSYYADAVSAVRKKMKTQSMPTIVPVSDDTYGATDALRKVQQSMGGTNILWLPLWLDKNNNNPPQYFLWVEKWGGRIWEKNEIELLEHIALFLGHALVNPKPEKSEKKGRILKILGIIFLLVFLALPVPSSVTAPAQVVPERPHYIFAPMDGIIKELLVRPGQHIEKGDIVFRYDARVLDKRLEEAHRNVAVAKAKLVRLQGAAYRDPEARSELPVQRLEVKRAEADVTFFAKQLALSEVRTGRSGVVVLDDPDALIGAAIQTGQAILSVADPSSTKIRVMVPATDSAWVAMDAQVEMRLDTDPFNRLPASVSRKGFEVVRSDNGIPSVMVEAKWNDTFSDVNPGQRGTVKIYGDKTRLGIQLLRKPLSAIRSMFGI